MLKKIFYLSTLVTFLLCNSQLFATTELKNSTIYYESKGTIHQEGEVLIALASESNIVTSLTVIDLATSNSVMNVNGCNASICKYDISNLNSGKYLAIVYFSDGTSAKLYLVI